jgi:hypothetical protein
MAEPKNELQTLLDEIAMELNEIDSVFIFNMKTGRVLFTSKIVPGRDFDAEGLDEFLNRIRNLSDVEMLGRGKLEYTLFQFEGGILHISLVPNVKPLVGLGFASYTREGMGMLLFQSNRYSEKLHELVAMSMG